MKKVVAKRKGLDEKVVKSLAKATVDKAVKSKWAAKATSYIVVYSSVTADGNKILVITNQVVKH